MTRHYLDLFSGIGGFALAAYWAGLRFDRHYFSEVEPYAVELYQKRFPQAIALGDIKNISGKDLPKGDWVFSGGFPCQDLSSARNPIEKIAGLEGEKSGLFYEYKRLISEVRPRFAVMENVSRLLSWFDDGEARQANSNESAGRQYFQYQGIGKCAGSLSEIGYDTEWQIISASAIGASHKRERVWIIAYPSGERFNETKFQKKNFDKELQEMRRKGINENLSGIILGENQRIPVEYFLRGNDGLSEAMDRIKGLGNAIVPQCAELIFRLPAFDEWRQ
ncbi:MAG: DNA (cytosine-5-)-methyltransferase [Treponema sp.]|nr:DNA (cytosine-5-)-methyltransferase [Treponema sp.]